MSTATLFTILLAIGFPWVAYRLHRIPGFPHGLSPAVLCYGLGILAGNLAPQWVSQVWAKQLAEAGMLIGLPLLLFGARVRESWQLMLRQGLAAFVLCCAAALLGTAFAAWFYQGAQQDGWMVAGMLTGILTGGSPNLQSLGFALHAPSEYVVLIQAADIIGGGIYLLLLMTVVHPLLGRFLPAFPNELRAAEDVADDALLPPTNMAARGRVAGISLILSLLVGAAAVGLTLALTGTMANGTLIILLLTTLSLLISLHPTVNHWKHTYHQGEYFILIFCIALGLQADFRDMLGEGLPLLAFTLLGLACTILFQFGLGWLFRIDRDTLMIGSTATIFGPPFIAQVVTSINNRSLLAPGIALALLGLAIGNYLGLAVAYSTRWLFF